jgi:2-polyprenyl-3-methyl-5-hydroxy-6-metoxy-1,4-benzoquinol methylase
MKKKKAKMTKKTVKSKKTASDIGFVSRCQICGSNDLRSFLSLGHHPVVQEYLTKEKLARAEVTYPLNLVQCQKCGLVQLDYIVDPKIVFPPHYPYRTGMTNMLIRNFLALADTLEKNYPFNKKDLIVDIGSNDGTLLAGFKNKGMTVFGVEPTGAAKTANKNGIPTHEGFFDKAVVGKIIKKHGKAKFVTATNVFAHINEANQLAKNIADLLSDDGVFISESQYLMDIIEKLEFDTIYHEHLRFYSLKPIIHLLEKAGMTVVDAERISAAGGSIRVYAKKNAKNSSEKPHAMSERLKQLIAEEEKAGLYDLKALQLFADRVGSVKNDLVALLLAVKKEKTASGKSPRIVGLGSPARSNSLLNYTKINRDLLDYAGEKNGSPKIGLFTPGTHIPVVDEARFIEDQPEYALVLSWHVGKELMEKAWQGGYNGDFIMPLPEPKIHKKPGKNS